MAYQTTYAFDPSAAIAGMPYDGQSQEEGQIESWIAAEDVEAGRVVELSSGKIQNPQGTSLGKIVGVVVLDVTHLPGGYKAGELVPVMRQGKIWAQFSGGSAADLTALNVKHSSTVATDRGKLSMTATSSSTGVEIDATKILARTTGMSAVSGLVVAELLGPLT